MKPRKYSLLIYILLFMFVGIPFDASAQIKTRIRKTKIKRVPTQPHKPLVYRLSFVPGQAQKKEIRITPKDGLFQCKIEWEGEARELRSKIFYKFRDNHIDVVKVEGRSPLYLTHLFPSKQSGIKAEWYVSIENVNRSGTAKGSVSLNYPNKEDKQINDVRQPETSDTISYNDFIQLDRCPWGEIVKKEAKGKDGLRIEYSNGNYILKINHDIYFFKSSEGKLYYILPKMVHYINAQLPSEPPSPILFTGSAANWRDAVNKWVIGYNADLLNQIKALLNYDEDLISNYHEAERKVNLKYFEQIDFRLEAIKGLHEIFDE